MHTRNLNKMIQSQENVEVGVNPEATIPPNKTRVRLNLNRAYFSETASFIATKIYLEELAPKQENEIPDIWSDIPDKDAEKKPNGNRAQRKRHKQRERRQRGREEKYKEKIEKDGKPLSKDEYLALVSTLVSDPLVENDENDVSSRATSTKPHPSPHQRTMSFFATFYETDTRPEDWVCAYGERNVYEEFPYITTDIPLLQLSALARKVDYATICLGSLSFIDTLSLKQFVVSKAAELRFFREHLRHVNDIRKMMVEHMGKHGFDSIEDAFKKLSYGDLVLSKVVPQLEAYHMELVRKFQVTLKAEIISK